MTSNWWLVADFGVIMSIKDYRELIVWQKSMELVKQTYIITNKLPQDEKYSLVHQMRRSAISIPSNIAEGFDRNSNKEFIHFLSIANGSKSELLTQIEICKMLGYIEDTRYITDICAEIGKMLNSMIKKLSK